MVKRSFKRAWTQEELWKGTGNKESFKRSFFSSDSVIHWMLINFKRNRKRYSALMEQAPFPGIQCVRIRSHKEARKFLDLAAKRQT